MSSTRSAGMSGGGREWLPPTVALTRFPGLPADFGLPVQDGAQAARLQRWALTLGRHHLLLDAAVDCELTEWAGIHPVPRTPDWVRGVINLRGSLVPVFDLAAVLEGGGPMSSPKVVLVLGRDDRAVGLPLEVLPEHQDFEPQPAETEPADLPELMVDCLKGVYRRDGESFWLDCDHETLLRGLAARAADRGL